MLLALSLIIFFENEPERLSESRHKDVQAPQKVQARAVAASEQKASEAVGYSHASPVNNNDEKFSFKKEAKEIIELAEDLPDTKETLIEIVLKKDIYKDPAKKVAPHSASEIYQNQQGALRVLALKALMESGLDNESIKSDLSYIIKNAQDPTIVKIASAARDSVNKGRSLFDDFPKAIGSMPHEY